MKNAFLDPVKVFQQPDTGAAMYGGDKEPYLADPAVGEFQQPFPDLLMIEISVFLTDLFFPDPDARMGFDIIIFTGVALPEDFVNGFATVATKRFLIENDGIFPAIFPAVETAYFTALVQ